MLVLFERKFLRRFLRFHIKVRHFIFIVSLQIEDLVPCQWSASRLDVILPGHSVGCERSPSSGYRHKCVPFPQHQHHNFIFHLQTKYW